MLTMLFVFFVLTVWDPEHGEIQAEFPLPIAVHRLDETPDMSQIITKVEKFADTYLPDETTWNTLVEVGDRHL